MKRIAIPSYLDSKQIESLENFTLENEFFFFDKYTRKQFYDLWDQYLIAKGGIAQIDRLRLRDLINQFPEELFNRIDSILGKEKAVKICTAQFFLPETKKEPTATKSESLKVFTPTTLTTLTKNTPSLAAQDAVPEVKKQNHFLTKLRASFTALWSSSPTPKNQTQTQIKSPSP